MLIKENFTLCTFFLLKKIEYMNNITPINLLRALLSSGRRWDYIKTNLTSSYGILLFIVLEFQLFMPQL